MLGLMESAKTSALSNEIKKINALDRMKIEQEKRVAAHNRTVKSFQEIAIDFMIKHEI